MREILLPFTIDGTGSVAWTEDRVVMAGQHLIAALGTTPGERVMYPTYGSTLQASVFDLGDEQSLSTLEVELQTTATERVSDASVLAVAATPSGSDGLVEVAVQFQTVGGEAGDVVLTARTDEESLDG